MAGMMPIVEMQYRRRSKTYSQRTHEDDNHFHGNSPSSLRSWIDPSMDEAALIARQRLEEKLGYFRPSSSRSVFFGFMIFGWRLVFFIVVLWWSWMAFFEINMAGTLPGVEMQYRRRSKTYSQRTHEDHNHSHGNYPSSQRSWIDPSMDEAALIARRRLEEKLGYFRPSSNRLNRAQANEGRANQLTTTARDRSDDQHLVSRILGRRPWNFQLINSSTSSKSKGGQQLICVVCLEGCRAEDQRVMELPCSHKFHSKCLNPWLASHPNCPSCRSPVQI